MSRSMVRLHHGPPIFAGQKLDPSSCSFISAARGGAISFCVKNYEILDHTADIRIRIKAKDLGGLFINAARAMFEIIADSPQPTAHSAKIIRIKLESEDLEELFVTWLNELLSLSAAKELIFSQFNLGKIDKNGLEAEVGGEDIGNYKVNTEIKAATYHQLKIEEADKGWQAEVIFDV